MTPLPSPLTHLKTFTGKIRSWHPCPWSSPSMCEIPLCPIHTASHFILRCITFAKVNQMTQWPINGIFEPMWCEGNYIQCSDAQMGYLSHVVSSVSPFYGLYKSVTKLIAAQNQLCFIHMTEVKLQFNFTVLLIITQFKSWFSSKCVCTFEASAKDEENWKHLFKFAAHHSEPRSDHKAFCWSMAADSVKAWFTLWKESHTAWER